MRCPNCGMDIVIATHLCPHCGYEHDFDGAIEKRRDIPEPWELTPGRAWKRRQRRERAASVWAENRAGREKVPEREFAVRESYARRSGSGGALMHVLCLVSFGIMALLLFGSALLLYTGIYYDAIGAGSAEYIYYQLPELRDLDQLLCIGLGISGLFALAAAGKLLKKDPAAARSFYVAAALFAGVSLVYDFLIMVEFDAMDQFGGTLSGLIAFAIYVGIVALHFRLNRRLYGG